MKITKRQLKQIIRETIEGVGQNEYAAMDTSDVYGSGKMTDCIAQLEEAIRACVLSNMSEEAIFEAVEEAYLNATMDEQF